ncbi:MAG: 2-hydroxychromene-2-carboxylate isomerase [Pseudomonadota bacterium]
MKRASLEFFFDLSSPWTYLAFHNLRKHLTEARGDVDTAPELVWRPILVGGVFNAVNREVYASRQNPDHPKVRHVFTWLLDWAALANLPMNFPSPHHPLKAVLPMRVCCALEHDQEALESFMARAFETYFRDQENLDDPGVVASVATACGLDGAALVAQAAEQSIKDRLRSNTDEAIERGAYGSPTMFVNRDRMYFGNDQLPLVIRGITA